MALAYGYTQKPIFIDKFRPVTSFFLQQLPEDLIAYWDLTFTSGTQPRDSSASAIAVCGMLEGLPHLPEGPESEGLGRFV